MKCLYATAGVSLLSLLAVLTVIHVGSRNLHSLQQEVLLFVRANLQWLTDLTERSISREEL